MTTRVNTSDGGNVHEALVQAAFDSFLNNDYHKVTTRHIAEQAGTSSSMIQYYFGGKQNLYEEMVRQQFKRIAQVLEASYSDEHGLDFNKLLLGYLDIHSQHPDFPTFLIKILAYKNGPGYLLLAQILDNKRELINKIVQSCQQKQLFNKDVDVDVLRILMMSASVFPFLIKGVLEHSQKMIMDDALLEKVAIASGKLLTEYTKQQSLT